MKKESFCIIISILFLILFPSVLAQETCDKLFYFWGDVNGDGNVDLSDAIHLLNFLFQGGTPPACFSAADANEDGILDLSDGIFLLNHLFLGGPAPTLLVPGILGGVFGGPKPVEAVSSDLDKIMQKQFPGAAFSYGDIYCGRNYDEKTEFTRVNVETGVVENYGESNTLITEQNYIINDPGKEKCDIPILMKVLVQDQYDKGVWKNIYLYQGCSSDGIDDTIKDNVPDQTSTRSIFCQNAKDNLNVIITKQKPVIKNVDISAKVYVLTGQGNDNIKISNYYRDFLIFSGAGDDIINFESQIEGFYGFASIYSGTGNDIILAQSDENSGSLTGGTSTYYKVVGGDGDDLIFITGHNTPNIIAGDDLIEEKSITSEKFPGEKENANFDYYPGKNPGDDIIISDIFNILMDKKNTVIYGGYGNDIIEARGASKNLQYIYGDRFEGYRDGNDVEDHEVPEKIKIPPGILGKPGNDLLIGGEGNDHIWGGDGDDDIYGGGNGIAIQGYPDLKEMLGGGNGDDLIFGDGNGFSVKDIVLAQVKNIAPGTNNAQLIKNIQDKVKEKQKNIEICFSEI